MKRRGAPPGNQNAKKPQARVVVSLSLSKECQRFVEAHVRAQQQAVTPEQCRRHVRHLAYEALDQAMAGLLKARQQHRCPADGPVREGP